MTMRAIRVTRENSDTMFGTLDPESDPLALEPLLEIGDIDEWYFIDQMQFPDGTLGHWEAVNAEIFRSAFTFDEEAIKYNLVPIERRAGADLHDMLKEPADYRDLDEDSDGVCTKVNVDRRTRVRWFFSRNRTELIVGTWVVLSTAALVYTFRQESARLTKQVEWLTRSLDGLTYTVADIGIASILGDRVKDGAEIAQEGLSEV